jgi:hypothetical protein
MPLEHMQVSIQLQSFPQYRGHGGHLGASRYLGKAYNVAGVPIHDTKQLYSNTRTVSSELQSLRGSNHHD